MAVEALDTVTVYKISDGAPGTKGESAVNVILGNEAQSFETNSIGVTTKSTDVTIPFSCWKGISRIASTSVKYGSTTLAPNITVGIFVVKSISQASTTADGNIVLTLAEAKSVTNSSINFSITADSVTFTKTFSYSPAMKGADGEDGKDGTNGEDGKDGTNGTSSVTIDYFKLNNSTTAPTFNASTKNQWSLSPSAPTSSNKYLWRASLTKIDGVDTTFGTPYVTTQYVKDGTSTYTFVKYGDSATPSTMYDSIGTHKYMGIYTGTSSTPPTTYSSYTWMKVVGDNGESAENPINVTMTSQNVTLTANNSGTVSDYSSTASTISVYEGISSLDYDGTGTSNGKWKATCTGVTFTDSGTNASMPAITSMASDNVSRTITITGKTLNGTAFTRTITQTISKSKQGDSGTSPVVVALGNEYAGFASDKDGKIASAVTFTIPFSCYEGTTAKAVSSIKVGSTALTTSAQNITVDSVSVSLKYSSLTNGTITAVVPAGTYSSAKNIPFVFAIGSTTITKTFTYAPQKQGTTGNTGASAVNRYLIASDTTVKKSGTTYTPSTVTFYGKSKTGTSAEVAYAGRFKIYVDGTLKYTSSANESSKSYAVSGSVIKAELYEAGGTTNLIDSQSVTVLQDGAKGDTGAQGTKTFTSDYTLRSWTNAQWNDYSTVGRESNCANRTIDGMRANDILIVPAKLTERQNVIGQVYCKIKSVPTSKDSYGDYYIPCVTLYGVVPEKGETGNTGPQGPQGGTGPQGNTGNSTKNVQLYYVGTSKPSAPTTRITSTASATTTTWTTAKYTTYERTKKYYTCVQTETYDSSGTYKSSTWSTVVEDFEYETVHNIQESDIAEGQVSIAKLADGVLTNNENILEKGDMNAVANGTISLVSNNNIKEATPVGYYNVNASAHSFNKFNDRYYYDRISVSRSTAVNAGICFYVDSSSLVLNETYTVTFLYRVSDVSLRPGFWDSYLNTAGGWIWRGGTNLETPTSANEWHRYSLKWEFTYADFQRGCFAFGANVPGITGTVDIAMPQIFRGSPTVGIIETENMKEGSINGSVISAHTIKTSQLAVGDGANLMGWGMDTFDQWDKVYADRKSVGDSSLTINKDFGGVYTGRQSLRYETKTGTGTYYTLGKYDWRVFVGAYNSPRYILSCYVKRSSSFAKDTVFKLEVNKFNGTTSSATQVNSSTSITLKDNNWHRVEVNLEYNSSYQYISATLLLTTANACVFIDGLQLERAELTTDSASPFSPCGTTVINGGSITTGTITADQIQTNAITAEKINVTAVNKLDSLTSPNSWDANDKTINWVMGSGVTKATDDISGLSCLKFTANNIYTYSNYFDIAPDEILEFSCTVDTRGTSKAFYIGMYPQDYSSPLKANWNLVNYDTSKNSWNEVTGGGNCYLFMSNSVARNYVRTYILGYNADINALPKPTLSGTTRAIRVLNFDYSVGNVTKTRQRLRFGYSAAMATGDYTLLINPQLRTLTGGQIIASNIVAGAVTTEKLSANAVTANKIASGAVTTEKLSAKAVNASKIDVTDLTVNKLESTNYNATNKTGYYMDGKVEYHYGEAHYLSDHIITDSSLGCTALGYQALNAVKNSETAQKLTSSSVAIGSRAMAEVKQGFDAVAVGANAMEYECLRDSVCVGTESGRYTGLGIPLSVQNDTYIGHKAMLYGLSNSDNVVIGAYACQGNESKQVWIERSGEHGVYYEYDPLKSVRPTIEYSTIIGTCACQDAGSIKESTIIGNSAGYYASGSYNVGLGNGVLYNNTGNGNTAVGYFSMVENTTGYSNTAVGRGSMQQNTTGYSNSALGAYALSANVSGAYNTAIGYSTLGACTSGSSNTGIGAYALCSNKVGNFNTAIGYNSSRNTTGSYNTTIGFASGKDLTTGNYNICIGYNVNAPSATASHQMNFGDRLIYLEFRKNDLTEGAVYNILKPYLVYSSGAKQNTGCIGFCSYVELNYMRVDSSNQIGLYSNGSDLQYLLKSGSTTKLSKDICVFFVRNSMDSSAIGSSTTA